MRPLIRRIELDDTFTDTGAEQAHTYPAAQGNKWIQLQQRHHQAARFAAWSNPCGGIETP